MTISPGQAPASVPLIKLSVRGRIWAFIFSFPVLMSVLFAASCGLTTAHHVMWRDEALAFLYARDSHSLSEMALPMQYDGHPPLWHLMLYVLTRFTVLPAAAQILHVALATLTVYLVTRFATFPRLCRILFPFGYYAFFEYGVVARNYQVFMLLSVLFCVIYTWRRHAHVALASVVGLLCFTHVLGIVLATGFGAVLIYDAFRFHSGREYVRRHLLSFLAAIAIVSASVVLSIITIAPPEDVGVAVSWHFDLDPPHLFHTLGAFWKAYVPIPAIKAHFWNVSAFPEWFQDVGGAVLALSFLWIIRRSRRALLLLLTVDFGAAMFLHVKVFTGWRHTGEFVVVLLCAIWIARWEPSLSSPSAHQSRRRIGHWLTGVLLLQMTGTVIACWYTWHYPFSRAQEVAALLNQPPFKSDPLVITDEFYASSIAAHLPGRLFFLPRASRWGTYSIGNRVFSTHRPLWWAQLFADARDTSVILISTESIATPPKGVTCVEAFQGDVITDESFVVYEVVPRKRSALAK